MDPAPVGGLLLLDKVGRATSHPACLTVLCCRICNSLLTSTHHRANCINSIFLIFRILGALVSVASLIRKRLPLPEPVDS